MTGDLVTALRITVV